MRARQFLSEAPTQDLKTIKTDIISRVKKTDDADLLQKIYTSLNKTGLVGRIAPVLQRDTDTKGYVEKLVDIIIDTPGTYEEKTSFIEQYPHGYIDIKKMLSGDYVKFDELITGGEGAPLKFVHRVFDALKQVNFGTSKGPGEFGLAVLSPHIKITGKGDLNIGKDVIEVKANAGKSGGRVGTPGLLASDNIPTMIEEMTGVKFPDGTSLNLNKLPALMKQYIPNTSKQQKFVTKLFNYIFKGKADISGLVQATTSGGDLNAQFLKCNYELYQKESGFTGMMLMNFQTQACKYFTDPLQMANEIYAFSVYLISANPGFQARQILSQVTLAPVKEPKALPPELVNAKGKKVSTKEFQTNAFNYASQLAKHAGVTDQNTIQAMAESVVSMVIRGMTGKAIEQKLKRLFPELVQKKQAPQPTTPPSVVNQNKPLSGSKIKMGQTAPTV